MARLKYYNTTTGTWEYADIAVSVGSAEVTAATITEALGYTPVAQEQGEDNAGKFLVVGADGNIALMTLETWSGGSY